MNIEVVLSQEAWESLQRIAQADNVSPVDKAGEMLGLAISLRSQCEDLRLLQTGYHYGKRWDEATNPRRKR